LRRSKMFFAVAASLLFFMFCQASLTLTATTL
jgi:hypothetical protein